MFTVATDKKRCGMCGMVHEELFSVYGDSKACRYCVAKLRNRKNPRAEAVHEAFRPDGIFKYFVEGWGWISGWNDDDGTPLWNEWKGTRKILLEKMHWLTGGDLTALSLSLSFGPTPCFPAFSIRLYGCKNRKVLNREATYELAHQLIELYAPRRSPTQAEIKKLVGV